MKLALIFISFDDKTQSRFLSVCNRSRSKTSSSSIDLMKSIICNRYWKLIYYWREFLFIDGNTATLFLRGTFHVTSESYDNKKIDLSQRTEAGEVISTLNFRARKYYECSVVSSAGDIR